MAQRVVIPGFRKIESGGGGEGGTTNYNDLTNKPSINNVPLVGNLRTANLKLTDATLTEEGVPAEAKTVGTKLEEQSTSLLTLKEQLGIHTVKSDVPENAVFTDTTYSDATQIEHGLMSAYDKKKLDELKKYTPDGTTITADEDGTLHGSNTCTLPIASTDTLGGIKPDGKTTFVNEEGVLSAKGGGGATITPKPTVNPQIKNGNGKVIITWEDPTDVTCDGAMLSKWAGTKLVMKEDGYPTSPDDGILLVDNTTRDNYKTAGFEKSGLTNDQQYYFVLFPYSTDDFYNYDSGNRLLGEPTGEFKIVTFAGGTDKEIAKMIKAHYDNQINIADYWSVGDTRTVSLSAMEATGVGESHRAQTVQFVIGDFDHDELETPINGHTKAAVTILQKDCLMDAANASNPVDGIRNSENGYMNSSNPNSGGWKNCARRTWCNNVYFSALPSAWQSMVKTVNKKSGIGGNSSSDTAVSTDKVFLAAGIEIFGSSDYSSSKDEGTQYQYYKNATANRYKMPKYTSSSVSSMYWERSTTGGSPSSFCCVFGDGSQYYSSSSGALGIAPCLCI